MKPHRHRLPMAPLALALLPCAMSAQEVRTAVVPDSILVGDIFRVAVRVTVPAGVVVVFPDTLAVPDDVEAAARRELSVDSTADGEVSYTAVFPLAAWRPGSIELPPARLTLRQRSGERSIEARFRPIRVSSVLPEDTAQIEPRPARDVVGASRLIWPILVGALLLLLALALAVWAYRRRRTPSAAQPATLPRVAALEELDRIRRLGYLEREEIKPFYTAVAGVLRRYTAQLDPRWGAELTTTELWRSMQRVLEDEVVAAAARPAALTGDGSNEAVELYSMLGRADLVKFARARPAVAEAAAVWLEARRWIERFPPPPPEPEPGEEAP